MIEGVKVKQLTVHRDIPDLDQPGIEPGILMEVVRADEDLLRKFGQSTFTIAHRGTIKGFHSHQAQDDLWFVATGRAVVVLHDLREGSPTRGQTDTIFAGRDDYKVILIPALVAHGYKVLSDEPVMLFYHVTEPYSAAMPDEQPLAWNDPQIGFDWSKYV